MVNRPIQTREPLLLRSNNVFYVGGAVRLHLALIFFSRELTTRCLAPLTKLPAARAYAPAFHYLCPEPKNGI